MRILVAHSFYRAPGGEDRYVRQQVEALRARNVVHLVERVNANLPEGPATAALMTFARGEHGAMSRAVRQHRPDVIHLHNPYPALGPSVHLAAQRFGIPLVQTVHNYRFRCPNGLQFTEGSQCSRCVRGRYDNALRHNCFSSDWQAGAYSAALWTHRFVFGLETKVDLFIAPSEFVQRRLIEWGIDGARTMIIRNFTTAPPVVPALGEAGLFLGRLAPEKGLTTLLEALRLVGDPPFDIVGDGPDAEALAARAAALGLRNVRFHGYVSAVAVPAFIASARYIVVPSQWDEVFGLAALEGMAAGRPVVATEVGGLPELIRGGGGRLVLPGNVGALAEAIGVYIASEAAAADAGAKARQFAIGECSPQVHVAALEKAYARAAEIGNARSQNPRRAAKRLDALAARTESFTTRSAYGTRHRAPSSRLHVLMVHCYYRDLGGENLSFEAESQLLEEAGIRVTTYTRDNRELDAVGLLGRAQAGLRTAWRQESYRDIVDLVQRERPDVVHFQNTFPLISPAAHHAAHRMSRPVVQTLRNYRLLCANGVMFRDGRVCHDCVGRWIPGPAIRHACYHHSVLRSSAVVMMQVTHRALGTWRDTVDIYIAPSEFARQQFIAAGYPSERIVVKPNFVSPDPGPAPAPGKYALFAGRLAPEKGVTTLLDAWRADGLPPLQIAGDGPMRAELEARIVAGGLEDRVTLLGHVPPGEVMALMRGARCVVFPSEWYETFGRVTAEAYAAGVPVVASRLGAMAEIVEDGVTGRLFTPGDPGDLVAAVRSVAAEGRSLDAMRRAARAAFEARYTAERNLEQLLEIYDRVRGREPAAGGLRA